MSLKTIALSAAMLCASLGAASAQSADLKLVAEIKDTRPGNIAISPDGRIFITQSPLDEPALRVVEIKPDGSKVPFPNKDWSDGPEQGKVGIAATIGIKSDSAGIIWILDMGSKTSPAQLVAWNSRSNALHKVIPLPKDVTRPTSFLQDFALDEKRGKIYIADMTFTAPASAMQPAFVVVDIASGKARRVLEKDKHLMPVDRVVTIEGRPMARADEQGKPAPWHLAVNAISIDPSFENVYFGTMNGSDVFRMPAAALADAKLDDAALAATIKPYAKKGPNDGFIVDGKGRIISGDVEKASVTISTPSGITTLAQDKVRLRWPDGFAFAPDGTLYIVANQLHTHKALNAGVDLSDKRYFILSTRP